MPAQVNAQLVSIAPATAATGGRDDWETPGTDPGAGAAAKWTGSIAAYYREHRTRLQGGGADDVVFERTVWVNTSQLPAALDTDDVITITYAGATITGTAAMIARSQLDGVADDVATTRIDLAPA